IQQSLAAEVPAYRDAWPLVHRNQPHAATFCVHSQAYSKSPYCCDFAFVSSDIAQRVRGVQVDAQTQASDHQPVLLDLDDR
ncbi:MAG TPA: endonuclease, partial [Usitatibacter sp.]